MKVYIVLVLLCVSSVALAERGGRGGRGRNTCVPETSYTPCPRCVHVTQDALDRCYMKEALNFAVALSPNRPYGALIVDSYKNIISCYGVSNGPANILNHGEMAAFNNCTALYPSPTNNDIVNPGLYWRNQTLYTTAEPCPMCATAAMWRGLGRVVYGTDEPTLARVGSKQITIRTKEIFKQGYLHLFGTGGQGSGTAVPYLKGGVLREETDRVFFAGFGFQYPQSPFYGTEEDVFVEKQSCGCSDHDHDDDDDK